MQTVHDDTDIRQIPRMLQFKRKLLPIDEYAARYKLPVSTIETSGKLGIVQIRKYKGKTYVVDVPYAFDEHSQDAGQQLDEKEFARKISELVEKVVPDLFDQLPPVADETEKSNLFGSIEPPEADLFETEDEFSRDTDQIMTERQMLMAPAPQVRKGGWLWFKTTFRDRSEQIWNVAAVASMVSVIVLLLINLRLSASLDSTTKTFDGFRSAAMKSSRRSLQQANLFSTRLGESRSQSEQLQEELTASRAQVKRLRGELMQSWKNSETVRRQNLIAVEQLEKQIQELTVKFQQLSKTN